LEIWKFWKLEIFSAYNFRLILVDYCRLFITEKKKHKIFSWSLWRSVFNYEQKKKRKIGKKKTQKRWTIWRWRYG